jgi:hypothetical protein
MKSNQENLERMTENEQPIQKYGWKKHLRDTAIGFTIMSNVIYGIFAYGLRSEGHSKEEIDSTACIRFYDSEKGEYVPFKGLIYWTSKPGRELGYYLYEKFPDAFLKDNREEK